MLHVFSQVLQYLVFTIAKQILDNHFRSLNREKHLAKYGKGLEMFFEGTLKGWMLL